MMRNATSLRRADACERCIFTPSEAVDKSFQVCQIWGTTPNCRERERGKKNMVARSTLCAQRLQVALGHFFSPRPDHAVHAVHFPARIARKAGPQAAKPLPTTTKGNKAPSAARERRQLSWLPWQDGKGLMWLGYGPKSSWSHVKSGTPMDRRCGTCSILPKI